MPPYLWKDFCQDGGLDSHYPTGDRIHEAISQVGSDWQNQFNTLNS